MSDHICLHERLEQSHMQRGYRDELSTCVEYDARLASLNCFLMINQFSKNVNRRSALYILAGDTALGLEPNSWLSFLKRAE